jgi:hypothetical protein
LLLRITDGKEDPGSAIEWKAMKKTAGAAAAFGGGRLAVAVGAVS